MGSVSVLFPTIFTGGGVNLKEEVIVEIVSAINYCSRDKRVTPEMVRLISGRMALNEVCGRLDDDVMWMCRLC